MVIFYVCTVFSFLAVERFFAFVGFGSGYVLGCVYRRVACLDVLGLLMVVIFFHLWFFLSIFIFIPGLG